MIQEMDKSKMRFCQSIEVQVIEHNDLDYSYDIMFYSKNKYLGKKVLPQLSLYKIKDLVGYDFYQEHFEKRCVPSKIDYLMKTRTMGGDFRITNVQFWLGNETYNMNTGKYEKVA
ncbi:hypothetical protein [uncultured Mediterranean phage uvMED]|nr:hypothetical protein [uncultured Mediterranean phage uvMED]